MRDSFQKSCNRSVWAFEMQFMHGFEYHLVYVYVTVANCNQSEITSIEKYSKYMSMFSWDKINDERTKCNSNGNANWKKKRSTEKYSIDDLHIIHTHLRPTLVPYKWCSCLLIWYNFPYLFLLSFQFSYFDHVYSVLIASCTIKWWSIYWKITIIS